MLMKLLHICSLVLAHHMYLLKGEILNLSKYPVDQFRGQCKETQ